MDINLKGAYLCSKEVAPVMLRQRVWKDNHDVFKLWVISSFCDALRRICDVKSRHEWSNQALALRLRPYITVNAICPGYIKTQMVVHDDSEIERKIMTRQH